MLRYVDLPRIIFFILLPGLLLVKVVFYFFKSQHFFYSMRFLHFNYNIDDKH